MMRYPRQGLALLEGEHRHVVAIDEPESILAVEMSSVGLSQIAVMAGKDSNASSLGAPPYPDVSIIPGTISTGCTDFTPVAAIVAKTRSVNVIGVATGSCLGAGKPAPASSLTRNSRGSALKYSSHSVGSQSSRRPSKRSSTWMRPSRLSWTFPLDPLTPDRTDRQSY